MCMCVIVCVHMHTHMTTGGLNLCVGVGGQRALVRGLWSSNAGAFRSPKAFKNLQTVRGDEGSACSRCMGARGVCVWWCADSNIRTTTFEFFFLSRQLFQLLEASF